jgi:hypothetical protein
MCTAHCASPVWTSSSPRTDRWIPAWPCRCPRPRGPWSGTCQRLHSREISSVPLLRRLASMAGRRRRPRSHRTGPVRQFRAKVYAGIDSLTGRRRYLVETAKSDDDAELLPSSSARSTWTSIRKRPSPPTRPLPSGSTSPSTRNHPQAVRRPDPAPHPPNPRRHEGGRTRVPW